MDDGRPTTTKERNFENNLFPLLNRIKGRRGWVVKISQAYAKISLGAEFFPLEARVIAERVMDLDAVQFSLRRRN